MAHQRTHPVVLAGLAVAMSWLSGCSMLGQGTEDVGSCSLISMCARSLGGTVLEATLSGTSGQVVEERSITIDELSNAYSLTIGKGAQLSGNITRADGTAYTGTLKLRGLGHSVLVPSRSRTFEVNLKPQDDGSYSTQVSTGEYQVSAIPDQAALPPQSFEDVTLFSGSIVPLDVQVPKVMVLSGNLIGASVNMMLQAFSDDSATAVPLSQPVMVTALPMPGGTPFTLSVADVDGASSVVVRASPVDPLTLVPTQQLTVELPFQNPVTISLEQPGSTITVAGALISSDGESFADTFIYAQGKTTGGGVYASSLEKAGSSGQFSLSLLPGTYTLFFIPPAGSAHGGLSLPLDLTGSNPPPKLDSVILPRRVMVKGSLVSTDTPNAVAGASIEATALELESASPVSGSSIKVVADGQGNYTLPLDAGVYRLDVLSSANTSATSSSNATTIINVDPTYAINNTLTVPVVSMAKAKLLQTMLVSSTGEGVGRATVRFFQPVLVGAKTFHILLGEGSTDATGRLAVELSEAWLP